jgi:hypothetical protein
MRIRKTRIVRDLFLLVGRGRSGAATLSLCFADGLEEGNGYEASRVGE